MKELALSDVKVRLLVKEEEWELVFNLLSLLKHKNMVEFEVEGKGKPMIDLPAWTVKSMNDMLEKAESEEGMAYEEFKSRYGL